jgi:WD40 repeat protein
MKFLLLIGFSMGICFSALAQKNIITATAPVSDFAVRNNSLIAATSKGTIETYSLLNHKLIHSTAFEKIKDFSGDRIDAEVFRIAANGKYLVAVVHGMNGFNDIYLVTESQKTIVLTGKQINSVVVDVIIDKDNNLYAGLLSNELIKFNLDSRKEVYRKVISNYAFSAMAISNDQKWIYCADESGIIHQVATQNGAVEKHFKGENLDNVLSIACAKTTVIGGGKDRKIGVYNTVSQKKYSIPTDNFVTVIALSSDAGKVAWYEDETNDIIVFDLNSKSRIHSLKGHQSMVNKIVFISINQLVSCGDDKQIIFWDL